MALKLTNFTLKGETLMLSGYIDMVSGEPQFDILFTSTAPVDHILPEEMNELVKHIQGELYDMKGPEPVKCEDGKTRFFTPDSVIERFLNDNAKEVQGDDRTQESAASREDAQ